MVPVSVHARVPGIIDGKDSSQKGYIGIGYRDILSQGFNVAPTWKSRQIIAEQEEVGDFAG